MNIATLMSKKMCAAVVLCLWWGSAAALADAQLEKQITNSIGMKLALIPAGKFTMGSPLDERLRFDNEKQVSVTLTRDFYLGTTEVTQREWQSVMGTRPCWHNSGDVSLASRVRYDGKIVQSVEVPMIYRGTVRNGVVVLPSDVHLADGQDVTVQPVGDAANGSDKEENKSGSGWPDRYFEQTAGALAGEEFERPPQGELPSRDDW